MTLGYSPTLVFEVRASYLTTGDRLSKPAPQTILVLCTGNSCRSQMAEVLIRHSIDGVCVLSAGVQPEPRVSDNAIAALREEGLPTEGLYPKHIDAVMDQEVNLVVTLCQNAKEACPVFPPQVKSIHLSLHDPHGEPLESFRIVRDDIQTRLVPMVKRALERQ